MPPLVGVAVNVTLWPEQIELPPLETILTAGVTELLMVIVIVFDVAVEVVTQLAFEVRTQVIAEPLASVELA